MRRPALLSLAIACVAACADPAPVEDPDAGPPDDEEPAAILIRQDAEPAGEHCAAGGTAVHSGRDLDEDGVLDEDEVEETVYVCQAIEIWDGDLTVDAAGAAAYRDLRVVTGALTVTGVDPVELPALEVVVGALHLETADDLVTMPALTTVGGDLAIAAPVALDALIRVGGTLFGGLFAPVEEITLPGLRWIGGGVSLRSDDVETLDLPALETVGGAVELASPGALVSLELPLLREIDGALTVRFAGALTALDGLPALTRVGGALDVSLCDALERVELPALVEVAGTVSIDGGSLAEVALPALRVVGDDVSIDSDVLARVDLGDLTGADIVSVHGNVGPFGESAPGTLVALDLGRLQTVTTSLFLAGFAEVEELSLPALNLVGDRIRIAGLGAMQRIDLGALEEAGDVWIEDGADLRSIDLGAVRQLDYLDLIELGPLDPARVALPSVVARQVWIAESTFDDLSFLAGVTRTGRLRLDSVAGITSLAGLPPGLVFDTLWIIGCDDLTSLVGLETLRGLAGDLYLHGNGGLTDLQGLSQLAVVGGDVTINAHDGLLGLDGLGVQAIGGTLHIGGNPQLASLAGLAPLTTLGGELEIVFNGPIPQAEIDALRERLGH